MNPIAIDEFILNYKPDPLSLPHERILEEVKKIDELEQKINKMQRELELRKAGLWTNCPHKEKVVSSKFQSGDYYSTSSNEYVVRCATCDSRLFTHTVNSGRYG